ncbi:WDGH domain-containing protein [Nocardia sp. NPDC001965]
MHSETDENTSDGVHTFAELYRYRMLYNALVFNEWAAAGRYDVHKSIRHSDNELCFGGGWFVVYATLPTGQIANHYRLRHWALFRIPERPVPVVWDGHTAHEAADRMFRFLTGQVCPNTGGRPTI